MVVFQHLFVERKRERGRERYQMRRRRRDSLLLGEIESFASQKQNKRRAKERKKEREKERERERESARTPTFRFQTGILSTLLVTRSLSL